MKKLHEWAKAHPDGRWEILHDCWDQHHVRLCDHDMYVVGRERKLTDAINTALRKWEEL